MRGIVSLSQALRVISPGRGAFPVETVGRRWRGQVQASWHRPSSQGGMSSVADGSSMRGSCKIAVAQMTSVGDPDANFETCQRLAQVCLLRAMAEAAGRAWVSAPTPLALIRHILGWSTSLSFAAPTGGQGQWCGHALPP